MEFDASSSQKARFHGARKWTDYDQAKNWTTMPGMFFDGFNFFLSLVQVVNCQ